MTGPNGPRGSGPAQGPVDVLLVQVHADDPMAKAFTGECLGLGYLAAALRRRGFGVAIVDANLEAVDAAALPGIVRAARPAVLGLTLCQGSYGILRQYLGALQAAGAVPPHIVLGGQFASLGSDVIMAERGTPVELVEAVLRGEADDTLPEYVARAAAGRPLDGIPGIVPRDGAAPLGPPPMQLDLDRLPFPHRDTLPAALARRGWTNICSSRGCYGACGFCSLHAFSRGAGAPRWRARSPENVAAEMEQVHREFGVTMFRFVDDNFLGGAPEASRERAVRIAELAGRRIAGLAFAFQCRVTDVDRDTFARLGRHGLHSVYLGVESGTQAGLDHLGKGVTVAQNRRALETLDALGLRYQLGFIAFHLDATLESLQGDAGFLREVGVLAPDALTRRLQLYLGTPLRRVAEGRGWRPLDLSEVEFSYNDPAVEGMFWAANALYGCYEGVLLDMDRAALPDAPSRQLEFLAIGARLRESFFDQFEELLALLRRAPAGGVPGAAGVSRAITGMDFTSSGPGSGVLAVVGRAAARVAEARSGLVGLC